MRAVLLGLVLLSSLSSLGFTQEEFCSIDNYLVDIVTVTQSGTTLFENSITTEGATCSESPNRTDNAYRLDLADIGTANLRVPDAVLGSDVGILFNEPFCLSTVVIVDPANTNALLHFVAIGTGENCTNDYLIIDASGITFSVPGSTVATFSNNFADDLPHYLTFCASGTELTLYENCIAQGCTQFTLASNPPETDSVLLQIFVENLLATPTTDDVFQGRIEQLYVSQCPSGVDVQEQVDVQCAAFPSDCNLRTTNPADLLAELSAVAPTVPSLIGRDDWDELKVELKDALEEINKEAHGNEFVVQIDAEELLRLEHLGENWKYAAYSCKEIAERHSNWTSGYYWIKPSEAYNPRPMYCELERQFEGTVGFTRIAHLDMTTQYECPRYLKILTPGSLRLCGKSTDGPGCNSVYYSNNDLTYQKVCGRAVGYHGHTPDGFSTFACPSPCSTIDSPYVDGLSITHGSRPRKHIWTYSINRGNPPTFVGDNYYCEKGNNIGPKYDGIYIHDTLWDGQQCRGEGPRCCDIPGMPWFCTTLDEPTASPIEVRWCTDQRLTDEDIPIEILELFIY